MQKPWGKFVEQEKVGRLNIHRWLNIANITPHVPDDGSVEPKRYSVDFSINLPFHLDYIVINFSTYCRITILYLLSIYIYISINIDLLQRPIMVEEIVENLLIWQRMRIFCCYFVAWEGVRFDNSCNIMAEGFRFMPLSLVRLRTFQPSA